MTAEFFKTEREPTWWPIENGCIYYCEYDQQAYTPSLFARHGVDRVASLQKAVTKRQAEYLAGRYCAKNALQRLGCDTLFVPTGKHREPLWPENIVGSISHSEGCAIACVTSCADILGLGIDLEKRVAVDVMDNIQQSIVTEREKPLFSRVHMCAQTLFTLIFSLKESFFKAAFSQVGRYFDFDAISLIDVDEKNTTLHFHVNYDLSELLCEGKVLTGRYVENGNTMLTTIVEIRPL